MAKENLAQFVIVDYGMGNLQSVVNAFRFLGCPALISDRKEIIRCADAVILPGVGAFGEAMNNLKKFDLIGILNQKVLQQKIPFLGICLGMQLIAKDSEEHGLHQGLGWINAHVKKIKVKQGTRLPHIGWNNVTVHQPAPLFMDISRDFNFYFVRSYQLECDPALVSATCDYDGRVTAAVQKDNILATQFHPEKSQENGLRVLRGFINFVAQSKKELTHA